MKNRFKDVTYKMFGKILIFIFLMGVMSLLIYNILIEGFFQDTAANIFVKLGIYRFAQNYKWEVMMMAFCIMFSIGLYFIISIFSKYLSEISIAIDKVFNESEDKVTLPNELNAMEIQLNSIKSTLKMREYQAKEAEQGKNDLVVYLAHDLKTPLTSVIGYLSLLNDEQQISLELRQKYISISLNKAERLEDLINEFFEITRFNLQHIKLEKNKINITLMLNQLADEFYPLLSEKDINCKIEIQSNIIMYGDGDKLARVFDNLLRNAINYSYESSIIQIISEQNDTGIKIVFLNQGDKIPNHKLDSIFEKFYRIDTSRTSKTGGSGLGLAIAKEIVELHNGTITAKSNEYFTEFSIFLPLNTKIKENPVNL